MGMATRGPRALEMAYRMGTRLVQVDQVLAATDVRFEVLDRLDSMVLVLLARPCLYLFQAYQDTSYPVLKG